MKVMEDGSYLDLKVEWKLLAFLVCVFVGLIYYDLPRFWF